MDYLDPEYAQLLFDAAVKAYQSNDPSVDEGLISSGVPVDLTPVDKRGGGSALLHTSPFEMTL